MEYLQYKLDGEYNRSSFQVLNLVINGIPSILYQKQQIATKLLYMSFKPCYKWNTFNTKI